MPKVDSARRRSATPVLTDPLPTPSTPPQPGDHQHGSSTIGWSSGLWSLSGGNFSGSLSGGHFPITIGCHIWDWWNAVNSLVFPGGPPAQYWPGLTSLRGGVRMGSCSFDVVWSTANIYMTLVGPPPVHYRVAKDFTSSIFHFISPSLWILPYIFCTYVEHI